MSDSAAAPVGLCPERGHALVDADATCPVCLGRGRGPHRRSAEMRS